MAQLEMNKQVFINAWVERPSFRPVDDGLGNDLYVDTLINQTRVTFTANERNALVSSLTDGTLSRAGVLGRIG